MHKRTDLVVALVSDTWADADRRGFYSTADQTILSSLEDDRIRRVLVADHPRGVLSQVKSRSQGRRHAPRTPYLRGVSPVVLNTPTPSTIDAIARRYRMYDRQLALSARANGMTTPALVTFNIWHAAYGDFDWASDVCFYAQDDESAIPRKSGHREMLKDAYARIARRGIDVYAVSDILLERIAPQGFGQVIPNGIDPSLWESPASPGTGVRSRPVAAYAGTIDSRIDIEAVRKIARSGVDVQMAGVVADRAVADQLTATDGVTLVGLLTRSDVVLFLQSADVCFLAHNQTELTEAMSPLKIYEYLCSGKPVVVSDIGSFSSEKVIANCCFLVEPNGDYAAAVRSAIEQGPRPESERMGLVTELSWRVRHRPLIDRIIDELT